MSAAHPAPTPGTLRALFSDGDVRDYAGRPELIDALDGIYGRRGWSWHPEDDARVVTLDGDEDGGGIVTLAEVESW